MGQCCSDSGSADSPLTQEECSQLRAYYLQSFRSSDFNVSENARQECLTQFFRNQHAKRANATAVEVQRLRQFLQSRKKGGNVGTQPPSGEVNVGRKKVEEEQTPASDPVSERRGINPLGSEGRFLPVQSSGNDPDELEKRSTGHASIRGSTTSDRMTRGMSTVSDRGTGFRASTVSDRVDVLPLDEEMTMARRRRIESNAGAFRLGGSQLGASAFSLRSSTSRTRTSRTQTSSNPSSSQQFQVTSSNPTLTSSSRSQQNFSLRSASASAMLAASEEESASHSPRAQTLGVEGGDTTTSEGNHENNEMLESLFGLLQSEGAVQVHTEEEFSKM